VIIGLSTDSRAQVDDLADKAIEVGARPARRAAYRRAVT
jgi:predicted lactoylglutathione lyase